MSVKIEKIQEKDVGKAHEFCVGIFDELGWDKKFAYGLENLKDYFSRPKEAFFLVKQEEIIGCGGIKNISEQEGLLKRFYIDKDFRGKGLAVLMLKNLKEFAKQQNYKMIVLDVFQDNIRAKRFFEKNGFEPFKPVLNENWKESQHPELFEFRKLEL